MAIPWLSALKVIPWGDVISHAPGVLEKARDLMARKPADAAPSSMATPNMHDDVPSLGELKNRLLAAAVQIDALQQRLADAGLQLLIATSGYDPDDLVGTAALVRVTREHLESGRVTEVDLATGRGTDDLQHERHRLQALRAFRPRKQIARGPCAR